MCFTRHSDTSIPLNLLLSNPLCQNLSDAKPGHGQDDGWQLVDVRATDNESETPPGTAPNG